ncbi:MAG: KEOPS complex kinase/ATPase Bud32 [Nanoarchaeota archaeon]|nr:KEOPS complex kinase/ATPase Bud32 [Nanoarchaeota archaeon]
MTNKLISQGAEAKIFLNKSTILKARIPKTYRHPQLDKQIRTRRTKAEAKILTKALLIKANVPKVLNTNKFNIEIEYIKGDRLSETLNSYPEKLQFQIMQQLGEQTALIHANNIIHGDLTTSNTILSNNKLFLIDFGLGFISTKIEDKAVDLHLIKQALEAKHFRSPDHLLGQNHRELFEQFTKGYEWLDSEKILERLKVVEKRGRYKH